MRPTTCEMFVKASQYILEEEYDKHFFEPQRVRSFQIFRFTDIYFIDPYQSNTDGGQLACFVEYDSP